MKKPNLFFKYWNDGETEPDMPKLGIDWWVRKGDKHSRWAGAGIDFIFFGRKFDITFTNNTKAYIKDFEDWAGTALLPY